VNRKITIVAATSGEIQPLLDYFDKEAVQLSSSHYKFHDIEIDVLISGIGIMHTTYSLMNYLMDHQPDAWIQIGIGGAFDRSLEIGNVYLIESEVLVDFGAQDTDGRIIDQFELGWMKPDQHPYSNELLSCPHIPSELPMPIASGMTTVYSHGYDDKIEKLSDGLHGQIENMEGAAFFYVSLMKKIPFLSIRAVSNYVESRDTSKWEINLAVNRLRDEILELLKKVNQLF